MSRAILVCFHNYVPMYDHRYFDVILNYFMYNFNKWSGEVDKLYLLDSNWDIKLSHPQVEVIKTNPNLRYYDAYKEVLPQIDADLVLLMDNDMVIYRNGVVSGIFEKLGEGYDVVSIYDTIGEYKTDKLNGKNKFCPYLFASRKELLMKYLDVDWGPDMPYCETLGHLTEKMLEDGVRPREWPEDKGSLYFDGSMTDGGPKNLGHYHIRAGSVPAYLLTHKYFGDRKTYEDYIEKQPKKEIVRQLAWYFMANEKSDWPLVDADRLVGEIVKDMGINVVDFHNYLTKFEVAHGL